MLMVTGPLTTREVTLSGARGWPPTPAKSKFSPLAGARFKIGTESWPLALAKTTPNAVPAATVQLLEANVFGTETTNVPLLTTVAPEYNKVPESVSEPAPNLIKPPPPFARV